MEAAIITHRGFEEVARQEIKELLDVDATTEKSVAVFSPKLIEDICEICYTSQSASHVLYLLTKGSITGLDDFGKLFAEVSDSSLSDWIRPGLSFAVKCVRKGTHDFSSHDVEEAIGDALFDRLKPKVDLNSPDVTIFVYVFDNTCYIGIDFTGFDLSKRDYKVFQYGTASKGTVAYSLLSIAKYSAKKVVVDPFSGMGLVAIEAAFYATRRSPHFHQKDRFAFQRFPRLKDINFEAFFKQIDAKEQTEHQKIYCVDSLLKHIKAAQQNAKVAGVNKHITFSRVDVEWLDTKFDLDSVDCIVSSPPQPSKRVHERKLKKVYDDFFYSAKEILKADGVIVALMRNKKLFLEMAERKEFVLERTISIHQGKEESEVLVIKKKRAK